MNSNTVHTYITGNSFANIFGGRSESMYGDITHIKYMTPLMKHRWPWMKGMWAVGDHKMTYGHFRTLKEAKAFAQNQWPGCGFKTPKQFRQEDEQAA